MSELQGRERLEGRYVLPLQAHDNLLDFGTHLGDLLAVRIGVGSWFWWDVVVMKRAGQGRLARFKCG